MPTATPFTALGAGNGFNKCFGSLSVDNFDYWTTFSGVNKNSPSASESQINESLAIATQIHWNLYYYGFSASQSVTTLKPQDGDPPPYLARPWQASGNASTSLSNYNTSGTIYEKIPMERVCGGEWPLSRLITDSDSDSNEQSGRASYIAYSSSRFVNGPSKIVRMYYQGEFVGYGGGPNIMNVFTQIGQADDSGVEIAGHLANAPPGNNYNQTYVTVPNNIGKSIHVVCAARSSTGSPNASGRSSSSTYSDFTGSRNSSVSIDSMDFYTY
jgi:hypothetical protein